MELYVRTPLAAPNVCVLIIMVQYIMMHTTCGVSIGIIIVFLNESPRSCALYHNAI